MLKLLNSRPASVKPQIAMRDVPEPTSSRSQNLLMGIAGALRRQPNEAAQAETKAVDTSATDGKILVLDLDETLLHTTTKPPKYAHQRILIQHSGKLVCYFVIKRPGVEEFVKELSKKFTIFIYTSSLKEYAYAMIDLLNINEYVKEVYHRDHCKLSGKGFVKDLSVIRKNFKDLILIDDSALQASNQPFNSFKIHAFRGEADDQELTKLLPVLKKLAGEEDVRPVELKMKTYVRELGGDDYLKLSSDEDIVYIGSISRDMAKKCRSNMQQFIVEESSVVDADEISSASMRVLDCKMASFTSKQKVNSSFKAKLVSRITPSSSKVSTGTTEITRDSFDEMKLV